MEELRKFYIQEKFKENLFSFQNIPRIICMKNSEVFIFKKSERTEPQQYSNDYERDYRLKAFSYGDWQLYISGIKCKYFQNREVFDNLTSVKEMEIDKPKSLEYIPYISIQEALKFLKVDFNCDMDYYLSDLSKIRNDLQQDLSDNLINENLDKIQDKLFYVIMCEIFDGCDSDEKESYKNESIKNQANNETGMSFIFSEFRLLYNDKGEKYATARRGEYYIIIDFLD
ncbi:unnamed protein product [Brachionus calyciflorus]|uniref:Uncharacterized protein n=1 Tax=Brachionus calyciflorus TaxID=104777 RepID=A0A813M4A2_9BILA|nr:unnamed protein product [Brachionus calyciflorus]